MAIIKKFKGFQIGATSTIYWWSGNQYASYSNYLDLLEDQNFALLEDADDNTLYFSNSTNDAVNLNPHFDKTLSFSKHFKKNVLHGFNSSLLFTTKPKIQAKFEHGSSDINSFDIRSTQLENYTFLSNLDLDDAYQKNNFHQFNIGSDRYTLLVLPNRDGIGGGTPNNVSPFTTTCGSQVILAKGSDLSTAEYIYFSEDDFAFDLLTVNVEEQIIYLKTTVYYAATSDRYAPDYSGERLYALPFKVFSNDGEFSFEDIIKVFDESAAAYLDYSETGSKLSIYYIGKDSSDKDCFLTIQNTENYFASNAKRDILDLTFFKIDYAALKTATTYVDYAAQIYSALDCFETHTISIAADLAVSTDYAYAHNPTPTKFQNFDPTTPNDYWTYIPFYLNNGRFSPIAINWNKGEPVWTNAFTLHENLINIDTTSFTENPLNQTTALTTTSDQYFAFCSYIYSYITSDNRLHFTFNYLSKPVYDSIVPTQTTLLSNTLSLSIDPTAPETVSYITSTSIPSLNSILLKDETNGTYNELLCITPDSLKTYFYTDANGWTEAFSEQGLFSEITLDSYGRRWAIEAPVSTSYEALITHGYAYFHQYDVNLHLISQVLPYTTSVEFSNTNVTYSGVDINNSLLINAYDHQGNRIEANVIVNIEGTNMVFTADSSTLTQITTSANSDYTLPVTITGPGYVNVSVSFDI